MNVLFIVVDDLRTQLGSYGNTTVITPNLDAFAKTAIQFNNAHSQVAVCGPSRSSFLSGLRPNTLGMVKLGEHGHPPAYTTVIPKVFKEAGYETVGSGKLFHGLHKLEKQGWTKDYFKSETNEYQNKNSVAKIENKIALAKEQGLKGKKFRVFTKGPATDNGDVDDLGYSDGQNAAFTIEKLKELKNDKFFIAIGFQKPHLPFNAPKKYWDMYNRDELKFPEYRKKPQGAPGYALANVTNGELHAYSDIERKATVPDAKGLELIHGYNACVSYVDAQVGKIMKSLEDEGLADNTIVVLFADHGWKLGEYNAWSKHTNYEIDTRVPLMIRVPGLKSGVQTEALAELVDVFPTLCELTNIKAPKELQGTSLVPVLNDLDATVKEGAFSQFRRGSKEGITVRTKNLRLVKWYNKKTGKADAYELYDHRVDPNETKNVFKDAKYKKDIVRLQQLITDNLETYK
ncbi:sulfatase [Flavobacteriaceae bacterium]|nr:sulfatase [Flavobacteriaceae bacterium]